MGIERLTERELEVLRLVAQGYRNEHIAQALGITVKTVERHIQNIYLKLPISDVWNRRVKATLMYLESTRNPI